MSAVLPATRVVFRMTPAILVSALFVVAMLLVIFDDGLQQLLSVWSGQEEYSYGYLIPFIALFFLWQKKNIFLHTKFTGSWLGLVVILSGAFLYLVGEFSTLYIIVQYAFLVMLVGVALSLVGWSGFKSIYVSFVVLLFMIPLPNFILGQLSSQLQLVSSMLGVGIIRLFGISVYLEGNVIDLGFYKLQVVEACSGLRYLFPLMTFGFIAAYFYKVEMWKRVLVFVSTIPITILMNSIRIGIIGVTVEYWGAEMADGFLHDFEGWAVFMVCTIVLVLEMWFLTQLGSQKRSLSSVFGIYFPAALPKTGNITPQPLPKSFTAAIIAVASLLVLSSTLPQRESVEPAREKFASFPLDVEGWQGKNERLDKIYIDALKFDDYIMANYLNAANRPVNFYVAYYASQQKGESAHSPRTCIPGGGWQITSLTQREIPSITDAKSQPLKVNRALIELGENKQLVYYWFQQRGRVITNEYLVKWYLFWDALTKNRTDGALVRVTSRVFPDEDVEQADFRLSQFASKVTPELRAYIPD